MSRAMKCRGCQERLSAFIDGDLGDREARAVAEHVAGCGMCAAVKSDLEVMCERFAALGTEPLPPLSVGGADRMWNQIAAGLDGTEREKEAALRRRPAWVARFAPAMGTLALAGGLGGASLLLRGSQRQPGGSATDAELVADATRALGEAEAAWTRAAADLRVVALRERDGWDDDRRRAFDKRLATIEAELTHLRRSARVGGDPEAQDRLMVAMREHIDLLQGAAMGDEEAAR